MHPGSRHVRLFKNGRNQAVRIPRDMELPGDEVVISTWEPLDVEWLEVVDQAATPVDEP